jgi:hypothetical protein
MCAYACAAKQRIGLSFLHVLRMLCAAKQRTVRKLAMVVGVMAFAGFLAGLLGIGGALIFNPVLLQLGVHPQARAAPFALISGAHEPHRRILKGCLRSNE